MQKAVAKNILVIPDIHGRTFWHGAVMKYWSEVDRIVFLGDYLDPYPSEENIADDIVANFNEIINLKKRNLDKVILLKGNHDEHYSSEIFRKQACGSRFDSENSDKYHKLFAENSSLFNLAHLEKVGETHYLFSHVGLTVYWLNKVNHHLWHMSDNRISVASPNIIERINAMDNHPKGQELLATIGSYRSFLKGEKTGSILWADVNEHPIVYPPQCSHGGHRKSQVR